MRNIKHKEFLINSSETGRFIIKSHRTGKTYFIEPQGNPFIDWGSIDQSTGKLMTKKGWKKNTGSTNVEETLITKENGFENITTLKKGISPIKYIEELDEKYPTIIKDM